MLGVFGYVGGFTHKEVSVTVIRSPLISNLAIRTAPAHSTITPGSTVFISGNVQGYPRPSITLFSQNAQGARSNDWNNGLPISARHFTPLASPVNSWTFSDSQFYGMILAHRTFAVVAMNSAGMNTQTIVLPHLSLIHI